MRRAIAAALMLAIALASGAGAQELGEAPAAPALREFATDRPDKTESPYTVDAGRFQLEADGVNWTRDRERGVRSTELLLGAVNVKLGVARSADVQVIVQPYVRRTTHEAATGARERRAGAGDLTLRLKRNLWGDDGGRTAFALMPFATLPTATNGVGADRAEFGLIAPLAVALTDDLGLGLMTELDLVGREGGSRASSTPPR